MRLLVFLLMLPVCVRSQRNENYSRAAIDFINSLNKEQQKKVLHKFDDIDRYEWHYFPASMVSRSGVAIKDLTVKAKEKSDYLLRSFLSKEGYHKAIQVMYLESRLHELNPNNNDRIPDNYFIAIYGRPETDSVWGWKFSGHHLSLNFTIIKDKLSFAPFFYGANPAEVKEGKRNGLQPLALEETYGFELLNMLSPEQRQVAIFQPQAPADIITRNDVTVTPLAPVGLSAARMTHPQKTILNKLIAEYLYSLPPDVYKKRLARIAVEDMDSISFGWAGETTRGKPHYYRIQGKTFLVEFDNTQNNANHIHSVWREFNGDFGADLLKEHYKHAHPHK